MTAFEGPAKCFGLLYRGINAITVLRNKLGSTDPTKAQLGTIRIDYGRDMVSDFLILMFTAITCCSQMHNGAHASDSVASAERERKIVGLAGGEPSLEKVIIEDWLSSTVPTPV